MASATMDLNPINRIMHYMSLVWVISLSDGSYTLLIAYRPNPADRNLTEQTLDGPIYSDDQAAALFNLLVVSYIQVCR